MMGARCGEKHPVNEASQFEQLLLAFDADSSPDQPSPKRLSQIRDNILAMRVVGKDNAAICKVIDELSDGRLPPGHVERTIEEAWAQLDTWQCRRLETPYAFLHADVVTVNAMRGTKACYVTVYTVTGIDMDGKSEILGFWVAKEHNPYSWMMVFSELKARGVQTAAFACIDDSPGLEEAILDTYPTTNVLRSVAHIVRNCLPHLPANQRTMFRRAIHTICGAFSLADAQDATDTLRVLYQDYPEAVRVWLSNFEHIRRLFDLPDAVRNILTATAPLERIHSALRKAAQAKSRFPDDDVILLALFLGIEKQIGRPNKPPPEWDHVLEYLGAASDNGFTTLAGFS